MTLKIVFLVVLLALISGLATGAVSRGDTQPLQELRTRLQRVLRDINPRNRSDHAQLVRWKRQPNANCTWYYLVKDPHIKQIKLCN